MGSWGTAAFDNDDASDWVYELEKGGIAAVEAAISDALRASDLEVPVDVNAIAAAEVVAAALGRPAEGLPDDVLEVVGRLTGQCTPDHAIRARTAVERVLAESEIAELWAESDDDATWRASVQDLIQRLSTP
jgi:hypothetical protein